MKHWKLSAII